MSAPREVERRADGRKLHRDSVPTRFYRNPRAQLPLDGETPAWRQQLNAALAARGRTWGELNSESQASGRSIGHVSLHALPDHGAAGREPLVGRQGAGHSAQRGGYRRIAPPAP